MKFVRIKKYIKDSYGNKPSFIVELDDNGVIREYISNGCQFVENTKENIEQLIDDYSCSRQLQELLNSDDLESYDNVTDCRYMLQGCSSLTELNLSLPSATACSSMLLDCSSLTELTLSLPSAANCSYMLDGCSSLTEVTLSLPKATDCIYMLYGCSSLTKENTKITYLLS